MATILLATYVDKKTFTVNGDRTAWFYTGRAVKAIGDTTIYGVVASSSYNGLITTVILKDGDYRSGDLDASLEQVFYGSVGGEENAIPEHSHLGARATGGFITETSISGLDKYTQAEVDTISGSLQTKIDYVVADGTDNHIAVYSSTGDSLEESANVTIDSSDNVAGINALTISGIVTIGTGEGALQIEHNAAQNRIRLVPYDGGAFDYAKELRFDADTGRWELRNGFGTNNYGYISAGGIILYNDVSLLGRRTDTNIYNLIEMDSSDQTHIGSTYNSTVIESDGTFTHNGIAVSTIISTYQVLRDTDASTLSTTIYVAGRDSNGDGGEGTFHYVSGAGAGTYTDDDGITLLPTGGDGSAAWLRNFDKKVNVKWYGAVGGGTGNDAAAIQAAIDSGYTDIFIPAGTYKVNQSIDITTDNVKLSGAGERVTYIVGSGNLDVIKVYPASPSVGDEFVSNNEISDLSVGTLHTQTTGVGITLTQTTGFGLNNVLVQMHQQCLRIEGGQLGKFSNFTLTAAGNSHATIADVGILEFVTAQKSDSSYQDCWTHNILNFSITGAGIAESCIRQESSDGLNLCNGYVYKAASQLLYIEENVNSRAALATYDTIYFDGGSTTTNILTSPNSSYEFSGLHFSSCVMGQTTAGLIAGTGLSSMHVENCTFMNMGGNGISSNDNDGNPSKLTIVGNRFYNVGTNNNKNGINVNHCGDLTIVGNTIDGADGTGSYGINLTGNIDNLVMASNNISNCTGEINNNAVITNKHIWSGSDFDITGDVNIDGYITLASGIDINNFSADGTLGGNSDDAVPTEKAVKTYTDTISGTLQTQIDGKLGSTEQAADSDTVDGLEADQFLRSDTSDTMNGDLTVEGAVVFNESGADKDFRVEGNTDPNLLFVDASTNRIGIGTNTPSVDLEVPGGMRGGNIDIGVTYGSTIRSKINGSALYLQYTYTGDILMCKGGGDVVIGDSESPRAKLDVIGDLILQNGSAINEFSIDGTLGDNSDDAVPTEKAVKTYTDTISGSITTGIGDGSYTMVADAHTTNSGIAEVSNTMFGYGDLPTASGVANGTIFLKYTV